MLAQSVLQLILFLQQSGFKLEGVTCLTFKPVSGPTLAQESS